MKGPRFCPYCGAAMRSDAMTCPAHRDVRKADPFADCRVKPRPVREAVQPTREKGR